MIFWLLFKAFWEFLAIIYLKKQKHLGSLIRNLKIREENELIIFKRLFQVKK